MQSLLLSPVSSSPLLSVISLTERVFREAVIVLLIGWVNLELDPVVFFLSSSWYKLELEQHALLLNFHLPLQEVVQLV